MKLAGPWKILVDTSAVWEFHFKSVLQLSLSLARLSGHLLLKAGVSYKRRTKLNEVLIRFISNPFTLRWNPYVLTTALHIFVAIFYSQRLSLPFE